MIPHYLKNYPSSQQRHRNLSKIKILVFISFKDVNWPGDRWRHRPPVPAHLLRAGARGILLGGMAVKEFEHRDQP
jgi:hypothetical protein